MVHVLNSRNTKHLVNSNHKISHNSAIVAFHFTPQPALLLLYIQAPHFIQSLLPTMVGATVSPSIVGSPAAVSSSSSSLFDAVDDQAHVQSDWERFDESPNAKEEEVNRLLEDMAKDLFAGGISENEPPKWTVETSGKDVVISVCESHDKVWNIAQEEIEAYRE